MSPIQIGIALAVALMTLVALVGSVAHRIGDLQRAVSELEKTLTRESGAVAARLEALAAATNQHAVVLASHAAMIDSVGRKAGWAADSVSRIEGAQDKTTSFPIRRSRGSQP